MHLEFLVEDQSGKKFLDLILPKLIGDEHTIRIHSYKGVGRIPKGMTASTDADRRILLDQLPRLLRGYGAAFAGYQAFVIVVCDLDDRDFNLFMTELTKVLAACTPAPNVHFCVAIEEGEAWFLGDIPAIKLAYPRAKDSILNTYINDSICGTWEKLADAVYPGGSAALKSKHWHAVGAEKSVWSERITPHMNVDKNMSPSFRNFRDTIRRLADNGRSAT